MNEENENINILKNYYRDILLISNNNQDKEKDNIFDELLYKYCIKEKYLNKKGTKILNISDFKSIISIIYYYVQYDDYIFIFLEKNDIFLIKIIINGYIEYNLDKELNNKIISIITKIIPLMIRYEYIYFIYEKLSKIFRLHLSSDNKDDIKNSFLKFSKIFEIWKLIFNYENDYNINYKYFTFCGNNNIIINITKTEKDYISTGININFIQSKFLDINNNINDSFLLKIFDKNNKCFEIKLKDIIFDEGKNISNINNIQFIFNEQNISYIIDKNYASKKDILIEKNILDINNIKIIELLKNFYGKISSIEVINNYKKKLVSFHEIIPDKFGLKININYKREILSNQYIILEESKRPKINEKINIIIENNKKISGKYFPIDEYNINNIKYFGGFEAFIPIFTILKFYIKHIDDKKIILNYIKDILKTIINKVYSNKKNLENLFDIIIPLTSALKIISDELNEDEKNFLFNNNIIYMLYIFVIISPISKTAKEIFKKVVLINENILNLDINYNEFISEKNLLKINSLDWYSFILLFYVEFILLIHNDTDKVPQEILEQFEKIFNKIKTEGLNISDKQKYKIIIYSQFFIGIINNLYPNKFDKFKEINILNNISVFINTASDFIEDLADFCLLMLKVFLELKNLNLIKSTANDSSHGKFIKLFLTLRKVFLTNKKDSDIQKKKKEKIKLKFINVLKNYTENKSFLLKVLEESKDNNIDFISNEEIQINKFINYNQKYRHIMKEQFLFNHFWSNKKLFFNDEKNKKNIGKLKYKYANYYTTNFQRPILSPILDYKTQYPKFSKFILDKSFYLEEETKDNYYFDIESKSFDNMVDKYYKNNLQKIKNNFSENIIIYDVCLIKKTHHIKGKLFVINISKKIKFLYFLSYSKNDMKNIPSCNSVEFNKIKKFNEQNKHLCYGSFFLCPEKDCNIKIKINFDEIRFIIRRIYFYRKTGIEIYTKNKSYYFNFAENPKMDNYSENIGEINCNNFMNMVEITFNNNNYNNNNMLPIVINKDIIGYSNFFTALSKVQKRTNIFKKNNKIQKKSYINKLLKYWIIEGNKYSEVKKQISTFDVLMYINLISNRSFNDLYQYPVFPLLFFYDKNTESETNNINNEKEIININKNSSYNKIQRDLSNFIGFQSITEKTSQRKTEFIKAYLSNLEEVKEGVSDSKEVSYFSTNYSNSVYTCNYLLRIFPYSFIAIELQGNGFDFPNRLFHSIESTLYSISYSLSDLRELIPEFYFLPEMLINLNRINMKKTSDGTLIDNVNLPQDFIFDEKNGKNFGIFKFFEKMRNNLEKDGKGIYSWLKLIFGEKQKYKDNKNKELLFRSEAYLSFDKSYDRTLKQYAKDDIAMNSVDFGLIPLQVLYDEIDTNNKAEENNNINKNVYQILDKKEMEKIIKNDNNKYIIKLNQENIINDNSQDIDNNNNLYHFEDNDNNIIDIKTDILGKIELYLNDKLITEYYEQKDIIKNIHYNKRLNMFITTGLDGFSCLYSFPNKLLNVIKHPNKGYFDYILLGSNPYGFIVAYDKINQEFYSFSLNGFFINKVNINDLIENKNLEEIYIYPYFDYEGGAHKDVLIIREKKNIIIINLPFFDKENK